MQESDRHGAGCIRRGARDLLAAAPDLRRDDHKETMASMLRWLHGDLSVCEQPSTHGAATSGHASPPSTSRSDTSVPCVHDGRDRPRTVYFSTCITPCGDGGTSRDGVPGSWG